MLAECYDDYKFLQCVCGAGVYFAALVRVNMGIRSCCACVFIYFPKSSSFQVCFCGLESTYHTCHVVIVKMSSHSIQRPAPSPSLHHLHTHTCVCTLLRSMELLISRVGSSAGVIILLQMLGLGWEPKWCKEREGNRRKASCCHYSSTPLHQLISSSLPEAPPPPPPSPH